jgi:hypothetical protein
MTKLNATQKKTIKEAVKSGFTYYGDSFFTSLAAGKRAINSLQHSGFLVFESNDYGGQYRPTQKALDFVEYGRDVSGD